MVGTNGNRGPKGYEKKFAEFIRLLAETKEELVLVHHPEVIGDNYEEIVESLNRLADSESTCRSCPETSVDGNNDYSMNPEPLVRVTKTSLGERT